MFRKGFGRIAAAVVKNLVQYPFEVRILTAVQFNTFPGDTVGDHFGNAVTQMQYSVAGIICLFFMLGCEFFVEYRLIVRGKRKEAVQ